MDILKVKNKKCKKDNLILILAMLALSFLFIIPCLKTHTIYNADDMPYHINRIQELVYSLRHGNWYPYMYTNQFKEVPYPLGIFYPQITLIPIAVLCIIFNNYVIGIYAGFSLYTFISMIIMYVIARRLGKREATAFIISIVYTFSTYRLLDAYSRFALGEFLAMTFVPMAIYGLYIVMKDGKGWQWLGMGLSFTLLSHVLSALLCVLFLTIEFILLLPYCGNWKQSARSLIIAIISFLLSSIIFIAPFLEQEVYQRFRQPSPLDLATTNSILSDLISNSLNNNIIGPSTGTRPGTIGIVLFVVMIWGMINVRKSNLMNKYILYAGVLTFILATNIFPWSIMMHTPLKVIQFPFRILVFTTLLLSFTAGQMFEIFYNVITSNKISRVTFVGASIIIVVFPWYSSFKSYQHAKANDANFTENVSYAKGTWATNWYLDQYTPAKAMDKYQQLFYLKAKVDNKTVQLRKITGKVNEMEYRDTSLMNKKTVTLPASVYKNVQIWQSKKRLSHNKNGLVTIHNTKVGTIKYKYVPSNVDNISRYISILTWLGVIFWSCITGTVDVRWKRKEFKIGN
ncbi:hypothetical protein AABM19_06825 [Limosilactobacillus fermentum]|nr:hypothetical protein [Limosilactobacillus fermentum]